MEKELTELTDEEFEGECRKIEARNELKSAKIFQITHGFLATKVLEGKLADDGSEEYCSDSMTSLIDKAVRGYWNLDEAYKPIEKSE